MITDPMFEEVLVRLLWRGFLGAALATIGFGVLFNVRNKNLVAAGLTGGLGGMVYQGCLSMGWSDPVSNFMAAIAISVIAEYFARKLCTTVTTFTACALIPLVPGGTAYEMMVEFSEGNAITGVMKLLDVITVSGMLAMGILMVSTLTRFFFYSRKKIRYTRQKIHSYPIYISTDSLRRSFRPAKAADKQKPDKARKKKGKKKPKPQDDAAAIQGKPDGKNQSDSSEAKPEEVLNQIAEPVQSPSHEPNPAQQFPENLSAADNPAPGPSASKQSADPQPNQPKKEA